MKTCWKMLLPGLLWAVLPAGARADNLDEALYREAPKVLEYLREHRYHNVGVLKFRVQKGKEKPSFRAGPLNVNLPTRLENALVLHNDEKAPLGIIHDADRVAQSHRIPSYTTEEGVGRLFKTSFPLAWGTDVVQADAFLFGVVEVPADCKKATVKIQAFSKEAIGKKVSPDEVLSFAVAMDRPLLNDLGLPFHLSTRSLKHKNSRALDVEAAEDAAKQDNGPSGGSTPSGDSPLQFEIRYDAMPKSLQAQGGNKYTVDEPQETQTVSFFIKNNSSETIGVVVTVNGKNTLFEEEKEAAQSSMWILEAGKSYEIRGFQQDMKARAPFRILSPTESEAMAYSDNLGLISVYVFRSGAKSPDAGTPDADKNPRSLRRPSARRTEARARSLAERKEVLHKSFAGARKTRGLIDKAASSEDSAVREVDFENVEEQSSMEIRYYPAKKP